LKETAMRPCLLSMVCVLTTIITTAARAEPCMVLASMKASYMADGAKRSGKRLVENCDSLSAIDEELSACVVTKQRDRACPRLKPGQKFKDIAGDLQLGARLPASMRKIADLLGGTQAVVGVAGVKRAHDGERWPGFPYGSVRIDAGGVRVAPSGMSRVDLFLLEPDGGARTASLELRSLAVPFEIPASALQPGASYKWRAQFGAEKVTGGFVVLTTEFASQVAKRVAAIQASGEFADDAKLFILAEVYEDFGLIGERDAALAQLK
jgi:hypothetical protein